LPDAAAHYVVSLLIASRVVRLRYALLLALAGLLPDIDALFRVHRWFTHSIFVAALASCTAAVLALAVDRRFLRYAVTASALYMLHIVFDVFTAPTPILWPLVNSNIMVSVFVDGVITAGGASIAPSIAVISEAVDFAPRQVVEGPILTPLGVIAVIATVAVLAMERAPSLRGEKGDKHRKGGTSV